MNDPLPHVSRTSLATTALLALLTVSPASAIDYAVIGWETDTSQISDSTTDGAQFAFYADSSKADFTVTTPEGSDAYTKSGANAYFQTQADRAKQYSTTGNYTVDKTSIAGPGDRTITERTPATPSLT